MPDNIRSPYITKFPGILFPEERQLFDDNQGEEGDTVMALTTTTQETQGTQATQTTPIPRTIFPRLQQAIETTLRTIDNNPSRAADTRTGWPDSWFGPFSLDPWMVEITDHSSFLHTSSSGAGRVTELIIESFQQRLESRRSRSTQTDFEFRLVASPVLVLSTNVGRMELSLVESLIPISDSVRLCGSVRISLVQRIMLNNYETLSTNISNDNGTINRRSSEIEIPSNSDDTQTHISGSLNLIQDLSVASNDVISNASISSENAIVSLDRSYFQLVINRIPRHVNIQITSLVNCNVCDQMMNLCCNYRRNSESYLYDRARENQMVLPYLHSNDMKLGHEGCIRGPER